MDISKNINDDSSTKTRLALLFAIGLFSFLNLFSIPAKSQISEPKRAIVDLYVLILQKKCAEVKDIMPSFLECQNVNALISEPQILNKSGNDTKAVIHYSAVLRVTGRDLNIEQYVTMSLQPQGWKIIPESVVDVTKTNLNFSDYANSVLNNEQTTISSELKIVTNPKRMADHLKEPSSETQTVQSTLEKQIFERLNSKKNGSHNSKTHPGDIKQVISDFYQAIDSRDCETARKIRTAYTKCESIQKIVSFQLFDTFVKDKNGMVHFSVSFLRDDKQENFNGYVRLSSASGSWKIVEGTYIVQSKAPNFKQYAEEQVNQNIAVQIEVAPESTSPIFSGSSSQIWKEFSPRSFGSAKIMNACFTPQKLTGVPNEKKTRRTGPGAYLDPPKLKRPNRPNAKLSVGYRGSIRRVDTGGRKVIALGFDIGERNNDFAGYDAEIIQFLRKYKVKATLYMGGKWLATHPIRAQQLVADPLFEIGNHAWTHGNFGILKGKEVDDQIYFTEVQYENIRNQIANLQCVQQLPGEELANIPVRIPTFRFPYGTCTRETLAQVNNAGLPAVQWNVVTADPAKNISARAIANTILKSKPGSIIVAHANGRGWRTGKALPLAIPKMLKNGWEFVTVSELLTMGRPVIVKDCYELRPGDNLRYNKIFGKGTGE